MVTLWYLLEKGLNWDFFCPGNSRNKYLGIWYNKKPEPELVVVWVLNRDSPLYDSFGVFRITTEGVLALLDSTNSTIWSSKSLRSSNNSTAKLLDSGNLVLKEADDGDDDPSIFIWQSFDYPTDTFLPSMKFGLSIEISLDRHFQSWKSKDDPSIGAFMFGIDSKGYPQFFLRKESVDLFRLGPWNGVQFSRFPTIHSDGNFDFDFVLNEKEMYFIYNSLEKSVMTRLVLNSNGVLQRMISTDEVDSWRLYLTLPMANCDIYGFCGAYSTCSNTKGCACLRGFVPSSKNWHPDSSDGCLSRKPLDCHRGDGFLKQLNVKLPDTRNSWYNLTMNLKNCESMCLKNCTCVAYANIDVRRRDGCLLWFDKLVDTEEVTQNGHDLYVRMASSEIGKLIPGTEPACRGSVMDIMIRLSRNQFSLLLN